MIIYDGIADAANAARSYVLTNQAALPDHVRDQLVAAAGTGTSPVDLTSLFVRSVYANRDDFPNDAKAIAAGVADLFYQDGYHQGLALPGGEPRALTMRNALRRDSGEVAPEGRVWPDPSTDPAVDPDLVKPPAPEETPAPPADAPPAGQG